MSNVDRRTILATGALALAGTAMQGGEAAAQAATRKPCRAASCSASRSRVRWCIPPA